MKKNKATIEDLAGMVERGFNEVNVKVKMGFDEVNVKLDDVREWQRLADGKFDVLEHELLSIKKDLENVIYRHEFEILKERVQRLERILVNNKKK